MITLNLVAWALLALFFITAATVLVGTYRGDGMVNTDRPRVLVVAVHAPGVNPEPVLAALRRQDYPAGMLTAVACAAGEDFEGPVRQAAAGTDAELVIVADAACTAGPRWVDRMAACFIPGVAMVRCNRAGAGTRGLDLVFQQAVEAGLAGLGARLRPQMPGFGVRSAVLAAGELPSGGRIRHTVLQGTVLREHDGVPGAGVAALAAWYRRIAGGSAAGFLFAATGGGALAGCAAAAAAGAGNRWQLILAFFYAALFFGAVLPLYLRGASVMRQSRLLGGVVPHALRRALFSVPALAVVLFARTGTRR